ncbi:hypothetical protein C8Q77DRAFT_1209810 [Trametes polyzona]|nr:hypothetical protein C8Q77DRAFT_1209810 [Trametes polyzona]
MTDELQTNARGWFSSCHPSLSLPPSFPPQDVLVQYLYPVLHGRSGGPPHDRCAIDFWGLAAFCESHFTDWCTGTVGSVLVRFHSIVYTGAAMAVFRRSALLADRRGRTGVFLWASGLPMRGRGDFGARRRSGLGGRLLRW